jgi:DNA-binding CsgD family transcriptional regulator
LNDFIINCGKYRDPKEFSKQVLNRINALIPFDQARLYFLDSNGTSYDEYHLGVDKLCAREYHEYSKLDNSAYALTTRARIFQNHYPKVEECIRDWNSYGSQYEFVKEYVRPHHFRQSFGFGMRDLHNTLKCAISLDRVSNVKYSAEEIEIMRIVRTQLDNLYQNFYVVVPDDNHHMESNIFMHSPLTEREIEIAKLLRKGVTPANISNMLCISFTTVKKHIANMHTKLDVSTRQELIVKLLKY